MSRNTIVKCDPCVTESRAIEIVSALLQHFGPQDMGKLLIRGLWMASDKARQCRAGLRPYGKRQPTFYSLSQYGAAYFLGMLIDSGVIVRTDKALFELVKPVEIDRDDAQRIAELIAIEANTPPT